VAEEGVSSVTRVSDGVINVRINKTLVSTSQAACFPEVQPATDDELVIINGRCHSTIDFRFYIYVFSVAENKWERADRPFFAAMFGEEA
jgi:hypothetical protein